MKKIKFKIPKIKIYGIDIIKNFAFFALFIFITLIFIGVLIAPAIKNFQQNKKEFYKTKYNLEKTKISYNIKVDEIAKLEKKDKRILLVLKRDFNINSFKTFANKFMKIESIKENKQEIKNSFLIKSFTIKGYITSPKNFYDFIDALKNYKYLIKVNYPIHFNKEDNKIKIVLKIEYFKFTKDFNEI